MYEFVKLCLVLPTFCGQFLEEYCNFSNNNDNFIIMVFLTYRFIIFTDLTRHIIITAYMLGESLRHISQKSIPLLHIHTYLIKTKLLSIS